MNQQLISDVLQISNYKGCLLTKTKDGYKILGRDCKDMKSVDKVLEDTYAKIIIHQKPQS